MGTSNYLSLDDCDPLLNGLISQYDRMLPLLTMDVLGSPPGTNGPFIAYISVHA